MASSCFNFLFKGFLARWPGGGWHSELSSGSCTARGPAFQTSVICLRPVWPTTYLVFFFSLHRWIYFYFSKCVSKEKCVSRARRTLFSTPKRDYRKLNLTGAPENAMVEVVGLEMQFRNAVGGGVCACGWLCISMRGWPLSHPPFSPLLPQIPGPYTDSGSQGRVANICEQ